MSLGGARLDPPAPRASLVVPLLGALLVASLSTLLLVVGARSPYTHSNLGGFGLTYERTEQAVVGPPNPYRGNHAVRLAVSDAPTRGASLWAAKGCFSCHGLAGTGGAVGPDIAGFDAAWLREKTGEGPGGMPVYAEDALTNEELEAIVAYLRSTTAH